MKINKTKTTVYDIRAIKVDFSEYTERFREIRNRFKYKGSACFICHKPFAIGDMIGLIFTDKGNKVVCQACAGKVEAELAEEKGR